jgi:hypothetical protein
MTCFHTLWRGRTLCPKKWKKEAEKGLNVPVQFFYKWSHSGLKAPPFNIITLGIKFQRELWRRHKYSNYTIALLRFWAKCLSEMWNAKGGPGWHGDSMGPQRSKARGMLVKSSRGTLCTAQNHLQTTEKTGLSSPWQGHILQAIKF